MFEDDPYRSSGASGSRCPRCRGGLDGDPERYLACIAGCGEWWAKAALAEVLEWSAVESSEPDVLSLVGQPFPEAPCPICSALMTVSVRMRVVFDHCDAHGVWLDRREREWFERAFQLRTRLFPA